MLSPWESCLWTWLWWHTIILPVNTIRMPDLLECQWALSPWNYRQLKQHNGLVETCGMQPMCVCVCVPCMFFYACNKPLAHDTHIISVWVCLWQQLSICIGSIKPISKSNLLCNDLFMLLFTLITYNVRLQPKADCGWYQMQAQCTHLIGLCLFLWVSTCVFCMRWAVLDGSSVWPLPAASLYPCRPCSAHRSPGRRGCGTWGRKVTSSHRAQGTCRIAHRIVRGLRLPSPSDTPVSLPLRMSLATITQNMLPPFSVRWIQLLCLAL